MRIIPTRGTAHTYRPLRLALSKQRAKRRQVRPTAALSGEHGMIDREDGLFGAIATVSLFIFLSHNGELVGDISHGVTQLWEMMRERR